MKIQNNDCDISCSVSTLPSLFPGFAHRPTTSHALNCKLPMCGTASAPFPGTWGCSPGLALGLVMCAGWMDVHMNSLRHGPSRASVWPEHLETGLEGRGQAVPVCPELVAAQATVTPPHEAFPELSPCLPLLSLTPPALLAGLITRAGLTPMCPDNRGSIFSEPAEVLL